MRAILYTAVLFLTACRYADFEPPAIEPTRPWQVNASLSDLVVTPQPIAQDIVVEGVVMTNDSTGNFFKQIILTDKSQTVSLAVGIGYYDSYSQFPHNEFVALNLNGLVVRKVNGLLTAGYPPPAPDTIPAPISTVALVLRHLHLQGERIELPLAVRRFDEITAADIGRSYLFLDTYMVDPTGTYAGERKVGRLDAQSADTTATLYTSPYATFANDPVPNSLFDLRAVVMSYKNRLQLIRND